MRSKRLGVALLAVFVMGAIVANSAYAESNDRFLVHRRLTGDEAGGRHRDNRPHRVGRCLLPDEFDRRTGDQVRLDLGHGH
jgi:hypothetical protein